jgi:hypothetical protein
MNTLQEAGIKGIESITPSTNTHIRIGIQGSPGRGKTVAAATFPNPVWLELENVLDSLRETILNIHQVDILNHMRIPVWKEAWVEGYLGKNLARHVGCVNRKDAIKKWINEEARKIPAGHTLIVDTWTRLQSYFDEITAKDPKYLYTKDMKEDTYKFWGHKVEWSEEIMNDLMSLQCNVVVLFHEAQEREKETGRILDKTQPVMQGKFITYLKQYFPNYFRALVVEEKTADNKQIIDANGRVKVKYLWQTGSDNQCDTKCAIVGLPMYVPAHYQSIVGKK